MYIFAIQLRRLNTYRTISNSFKTQFKTHRNGQKKSTKNHGSR